MSISYLGQGSGTVSGSTTLSVAAPVGVTFQPGDLLLWWIFTSNADTVTQASAAQIATISDTTIWARTWQTGDPSGAWTFTTASSETSDGFLVCYRSTFGTMAVDNVLTAAASGTSAATPRPVATFGADWLLIGARGGASPTWSRPAGTQNRATGYMSLGSGQSTLTLDDFNGPTNSTGAVTAYTYGASTSISATYALTLREGTANSIVMLL